MKRADILANIFIFLQSPYMLVFPCISFLKRDEIDHIATKKSGKCFSISA